MAERITSGEESVSTLEMWVTALERFRDQHRDTAISLQPHLEDIEDRSRRQNLRLRGIPEDTEVVILGDTVRDIFCTVLVDQEATIEPDRVHTALGPRPANPSRPRDVVCRFHRYLQKENVLCRAWEHGDVATKGTHVRILPDLSRATLKRSAMLRPVLDFAKQ